MGPEAYFLFGSVAAVLFLVAGMRAVALRAYRSRFDPGAPTEFVDGSLRGLYSGRKAKIGLIPSDRSTSRPAKVQVSIVSSVPIRIEAHRKTMAVLLRKAVGIIGSRPTGFEDLDHRYTFQFDDRAKTESVLARIEARQSLLALADLGADFVLLTNGRLTAEIPMTYVIPPGAGCVGDALTAMHTFASSAESALGVPSPERTWTADTLTASEEDDYDTWPAARTSGTTISAPVFFATIFISILLGFLVIGGFWDFNGRVPWQTRMALVTSRLPTVALVACAGCFLAAAFVPRRPIFWALQVSWPLVAHAALVGVFYLVLRGSGIPEIQDAFGRELEAIPAGLKTASIAAGVGLGSGLIGAVLGRRWTNG